ncbi:hypothetical protein AHYW_004038 [Providencia manganoxydans]|uniref:hypothetical protein n=1 Tax=Providencia manganoxydans TaxID=2923283 RepID=UPI003B9D971B
MNSINEMNARDMLIDSIMINRLSVAELKKNTMSLIKEQYDEMVKLNSGMLGTIGRVERNIRNLNEKMNGLDKNTNPEKYEYYQSRLIKSKSILIELEDSAKEMERADLAQMAKAHFFRKTMDRAEKSANHIFEEYSNGNLNLDEMKTRLDSLKDDIAYEIDRLVPYRKVNELIGGGVASGLQQLNEYGEKIGLLYNDSIEAFSENIDKIKSVAEANEAYFEEIVQEPPFFVPVDILNQQISGFENSSEGLSRSSNEMNQQVLTSRQNICLGRTALCGVTH